MLTIVFFFVNARFRLPLLPFLIILAAFSILFLWDRVKRKEYLRLLPAGLGLVLFFWFCNANPYDLSKTSFSQSYFTLGNIYLRQDLRDRAKVYYDSALALNPNLPRAHLNLGLIHLGKGDLDSAGAAFARVLAINPYEEKALNNLSAVYRLKGEYKKSVQFAKAAVELRPNYIFAYSNLSQAYVGLNQPDSALLRYWHLRRDCPSPPKVCSLSTIWQNIF
jgi:tetratricopeptide (TPR) repeat protein